MIKLQISTPEEVPLIEVVFFKCCSTQPAPLILALRTSHMIAPFVCNFSDSSLTSLAVYNITLLFCPLSIVVIFSLITCQTLVIGPSTRETDLNLALLTYLVLFIDG